MLFSKKKSTKKCGTSPKNDNKTENRLYNKVIIQKRKTNKKQPPTKLSGVVICFQLSVCFFGEGGLSPCSSVFVQESLGNGLVNLLDSSFDKKFLVLRAGFDSGVGLFDFCFQLRTGSFVLSRFRSNHLNTLFGGFNVGHGHTSSKKIFHKSRTDYHNTNFLKKQHFF